MQKYKWVSKRLQKKAQVYHWLTILFMALTLVALYLPVESLKVLNLIPLVVAVALWVIAMRIQNADKKLRRMAKQGQ